MSDSMNAQVEAAKAYERLFVPALFGEWAPRVADAARIESGQRVLDVACGTGVLAREVVARAAPQGYVAGIDPGAGMLEVAKELAPSVDWKQGVAEDLPFPDESFDAVVSQFGLMFFADREKAIREMWRVLKPGGRMAVAVWDSLENTPVYAADVDILDRVAGKPAADALRAPFVLGDKEELRSVFDNAGVAGVEIDTQVGLAQFPSLPVMVEADLRGWLPVMGVELEDDQIGRIVEEAKNVLGSYVTDDGRMVFDSPAHIVFAEK